MILTNCRVIPELCEGFEEERVDIRIEGKKSRRFYQLVRIIPANGL